MSAVAVGLLALFILIYGALAIVAIRRPLLARLAAREALRRPVQSALLVCGLMIAGVSITAGLVIADSSEASLRASAARGWGRVDLTVAAGGQFFAPDVAARLAADPSLRSDAGGVQAGVELVTSVADLDRRLAKSAVRLIGFDPTSQPLFGAFLLTDGRRTYGVDLPPGSVLLSRNLAEALEAQVGDRLQLATARPGAVPPVTLVVGGISRSEWAGTYGQVPAVFATLDTARLLTATDQINVVRISAKGDGDAEIAAAHRLAALMPAAEANLPIASQAVVREVKANDLAMAHREGDRNRTLFLALSFVVLVAAATLAVNLALALSEERRPRLAVLRALGLTRAGLVTMSALEGALYSLVAAALGAVPGVVAGVFLGGQLRSSYAGSLFEAKSDVVTSVRPETLVVAILGATLITLTTLSITALRTSRMTIVAAIRDLPDQRPVPGRSWSRRLALGAVTLVALPAVALGNQVRLLGGAALLIVAVTLARNLLSQKTRATLIGAGLAIWPFLLTATGPRDFNLILPMVLSVAGLCLLVVANLNFLEATVMRLGLGSGRARATLRPPLAYLGRRTLRTGLATGAFAIILAAIVLLGIFISAQSTYGRDAVRMDVRVATPGSEPALLPARVQSVISAKTSIPTRVYTGPVESSLASIENSFIRLYEMSNEQLADPPVSLFSRDDRFKTDAAVWQAIRDDPTWVVSFLLAPGQSVTLQGDRGRVRVRIAAQQLPGSLDGMIGSRAALKGFQGLPLENTTLLKLRPGADPSVLAREIRQSAFPQPIDATPTREPLESILAATHTWVSLLSLLIGLALLTGVLAIGILALRAFVERRHAIGVLRSIGYRRWDVVTGLVAEATITTSIGVAVGLVAGALFGFISLRGAYPDAPYGWDWGITGTTLGLIYVTLILVTIAPAVQTARLPPAQALRLQE